MYSARRSFSSAFSDRSGASISAPAVSIRRRCRPIYTLSERLSLAEVPLGIHVLPRPSVDGEDQPGLAALRARSQPGDLHARRDQVADAHQHLLVARVEKQVPVARLDQNHLAVDEVRRGPLDLAAGG